MFKQLAYSAVALLILNLFLDFSDCYSASHYLMFEKTIIHKKRVVGEKQRNLDYFYHSSMCQSRPMGLVTFIELFGISQWD